MIRVTAVRASGNARIFCFGGCGASVADEEEATDRGWDYLEITGRRRCYACTSALREASSLAGINPTEPFVDPLPKDSTGALTKKTADTIMPADPGLKT